MPEIQKRKCLRNVLDRNVSFRRLSRGRHYAVGSGPVADLGKSVRVSFVRVDTVRRAVTTRRSPTHDLHLLSRTLCPPIHRRQRAFLGAECAYIFRGSLEFFEAACLSEKDVVTEPTATKTACFAAAAEGGR